jgi:hypothetical protein
VSLPAGLVSTVEGCSVLRMAIRGHIGDMSRLAGAVILPAVVDHFLWELVRRHPSPLEVPERARNERRRRRLGRAGTGTQKAAPRSADTACELGGPNWASSEPSRTSEGTPDAAIGPWPGAPRLRRGAYSTLLNGQSDASQPLTARQRGTSTAAWLARTQESARASSSLSGSG